jgi:hypothetical protein
MPVFSSPRKVAHRIVNVVLCLFAGALLLACTIKPDEQPTLNELIYDPHRVMLLDPKDRVRRTTFLGVRDYRKPNSSNFDTWQFKFESDTDVMRVTVNDTYGVGPGNSYSYTLSQLQGGNAVQVWYLKTENPIGATERKQVFKYEFRLNPNPAVTDPVQLQFKPDIFVQGDYEFSQSQRDITVDISFDVRKKMPIAEARPIPD